MSTQSLLPKQTTTSGRRPLPRPDRHSPAARGPFAEHASRGGDCTAVHAFRAVTARAVDSPDLLVAWRPSVIGWRSGDPRRPPIRTLVERAFRPLGRDQVERVARRSQQATSRGVLAWLWLSAAASIVSAIRSTRRGSQPSKAGAISATPARTPRVGGDRSTRTECSSHPTVPSSAVIRTKLASKDS